MYSKLMCNKIIIQIWKGAVSHREREDPGDLIVTGRTLKRGRRENLKKRENDLWNLMARIPLMPPSSYSMSCCRGCMVKEKLTRQHQILDSQKVQVVGDCWVFTEIAVQRRFSLEGPLGPKHKAGVDCFHMWALEWALQTMAAQGFSTDLLT